jgi:hypothetical protein
MVDVTPTRIMTFRITRRGGDQISVVACDDANTLQVFGANADKRVLIKRTDMTQDKIQHAVITTLRAFENHDIAHFSDIAREIKEEFNKKFDRDWHCFIIEKGGHSITHDDGCYICLDIGDPMVVLFK